MRDLVNSRSVKLTGFADKSFTTFISSTKWGLEISQEAFIQDKIHNFSSDHQAVYNILLYFWEKEKMKTMKEKFGVEKALLAKWRP